MGGGKSYVGLACLILLARIYPGSKWCVIRESGPTLESTSIQTFRRILPSNFLLKENLKDHTFTFKNGSVIFFMAENFHQDKEFDRFKGLEVNGFLLEQIEELQLKLLQICFIRAGRWKIDKMPPRPIILCNVNPTLLWPKAEIYNKWVKGTLPPDWCYVPATISDNPMLFDDKNYMHNATMHLDDLMRRQMIEGDWDAFPIENQYFYNWSTSKHVVPAGSFTPNRHLPISLSFDFNVNPMTAKVGQKTSLMTGRIFKEYDLQPGSTEQVCNKILADFPQFIGNMQVTGDKTGRNRQAVTEGNLNHYRLIKQLLKCSDRDMDVEGVNMAHKDSRVLCNAVLTHADFAVTEDCPLTIQDCFGAQVDEWGELLKTSKEGRHHFDNTRYQIHSWYPDFITNAKKYH